MKKTFQFVNLFFILLLIISYPGSLKAVPFCDRNEGYGPTSKLDEVIIDDFDGNLDWKTGKCKNEMISLSTVPGKKGKAVHVDYKFQEDGQYVYLSRPVQIDLTGKRRISFWLCSQGLSFNLVLKIIDSDGGYFLYNSYYRCETSDWHKEEFDTSSLVYGWGGSNKTMEPPFKLEFTIERGFYEKKSR